MEARLMGKKRRHGDLSLRVRLLKHEGNNDLRTAAWVIRLSRLSDSDLLAITGKKMCNERRAAERILEWRQRQQK